MVGQGHAGNHPPIAPEPLRPGRDRGGGGDERQKDARPGRRHEPEALAGGAALNLKAQA